MSNIQLRKLGTQRDDGNNSIDLQGTDGNWVSIGRAINSTRTINNQYLSRTHSVLKWNGNEWTLEDLNSINGTYINTTRLQPFVPTGLSIGDEIGFGVPVTYRDNDDTLVYQVYGVGGEAITARCVQKEDDSTSSDHLIKNIVEERNETNELPQRSDVSRQEQCETRAAVVVLTRCDEVNLHPVYEISDDEAPVDDNFHGYSQEDEVIVISDTEEELQFQDDLPALTGANDELISINEDSDCKDSALYPLPVKEAQRRIPTISDLSDSSDSDRGGQRDEDPGDFFPELSQAFFESDELQEVRIGKSSGEKLGTPSPMLTTRPNVQQTLVPRAHRTVAIPVAAKASAKRPAPKSKQVSLKKKVLQSMDYRMRVAGGGSDVTRKSAVTSKSTALATKPVTKSPGVAGSSTTTTTTTRSILISPIAHTRRRGSDVHPKDSLDQGSSKTSGTRHAQSSVDAVVVAAACTTLQSHPCSTVGGKRRRLVADPSTTGPATSGSTASRPSASRPSASGPSISLRNRVPNDTIPLSVTNKLQDAQPGCSKWTDNANAQRTDGLLNSILGDILNWRMIWFSEAKRTRNAPPILPPSDFLRTKLVYKSPDEYIKTYRTLMMLEIWEELSSSMSNGGKSLMLEYLHTSATFDEDNSNAMLMHFHGVVPKHTEDDEDFPRDSWVVNLQIPLNSCNEGKREIVSVLAYIESSTKMPYQQFLRSSGSTDALNRIAATIQKEEKTLLTFTLRTKKITDFTPNKIVLFKMTLLTKLRKNMTLFKALTTVMNSALGQCLLDPQGKLCDLPPVDPKFRITTEGSIPFNKEQETAIMRVTKACLSVPHEPTVAMIHGPPGTGKTAVVAGIIMELLHGANVPAHPKPLILLCAPSNNAVDEDIRRLKKKERAGAGAGAGGRQKLKIVRLGQLQHISEDIRNIHVDTLVGRNIRLNEHSIRLYDEAITGLQKTIYKARQDLRCARNEDLERLKLEITKQESLLCEQENKRKSCEAFARKTCREQHERQRESILKGADVIASTLGSCCQGGMDMLQSDRKRPIICIVDEATQCMEPDILVLLQYGVNKLVLVGDPCQLPPTVISQKAKELGYEQSLFDRLYNGLRKEGRTTPPALLLETQYRMHPEICRFPSVQFYDDKLVTHNGLAEKLADNDLLPYSFFNMLDSQEIAYTNPTEVAFIVRLVEVLWQLTGSKYQVGIITFYAAQKQLLIDRIKGAKVEINTVDGFQGRESDVVIVSTVRANKDNVIGFLRSERRLNVAITRARTALIICGHRPILQTNRLWNSLIVDAEKRQRVFDVTSTTTNSHLIHTLRR